jgi:hypothetical protein
VACPPRTLQSPSRPKSISPQSQNAKIRTTPTSQSTHVISARSPLLRIIDTVCTSRSSAHIYAARCIIMCFPFLGFDHLVFSRYPAMRDLSAYTHFYMYLSFRFVFWYRLGFTVCKLCRCTSGLAAYRPEACLIRMDGHETRPPAMSKFRNVKACTRQTTRTLPAPHHLLFSYLTDLVPPIG